MPADLLAIFIKFRDFLVTLAPWVILGLIAASGIVAAAPVRSARRAAKSRVVPVAAGLVLVLPSMFGSFGMDLRLGLARLGFTLAALAVGSIFATESERTSAVTAWIGDGLPSRTETGWIDQTKRLWKLLGERFDDLALWFIGACAVAGVLGVFVPYQVGFDLFSRTTWLGALFGALIGTALKRGTGMDLPIASLLVLKGGGLGAAAALLLASTPLPIRLWRDGPRGWIAGAAIVTASTGAGMWIGPQFL